MAQPIRVLIADDYPRSRSGLKALLATWPKIEVIAEAVDGRHAVQQVAQCHPDVVLMDAEMPVMDGLEATRRIKHRWPEVGVIMLTIYGAYRPKAMAAGVDAFIDKADPPDILQTALDHFWHTV